MIIMRIGIIIGTIKSEIKVTKLALSPLNQYTT